MINSSAVKSIFTTSSANPLLYPESVRSLQRRWLFYFIIQTFNVFECWPRWWHWFLPPGFQVHPASVFILLPAILVVCSFNNYNFRAKIDDTCTSVSSSSFALIKNLSTGDHRKSFKSACVSFLLWVSIPDFYIDAIFSRSACLLGNIRYVFSYTGTHTDINFKTYRCVTFLLSQALNILFFLFQNCHLVI